MKRLPLFTLILLTFIACNPDDEMPMEPGYEGYTLVWADEFDSNIDPDNWVFETGDGTDYGLPPGWGNGERQLYTTSVNNVAVLPDGEGNSALAIIARKEPGNNNFSSAKLTTNGLHSVRFGRVEARIKIPDGQGMWPAFWLLGENHLTEIDWPGCGEIDIMEVIGHMPDILHTTVHYANSENKLESDGQGYDASENLGDDYHEYRLDWTPESMTFSLDGVEVYEVPIEDDMKEFLRPHYIILNLAVGGYWPGDPDDTTVFPKTMYVDWVRVYSQDDLNPPAAPILDIDEETIGQISTSLADHAFNSTLNPFSGAVLKSYGDGGEPQFSASDIAIEGDSSVLLSYPGNSWGGAFFVLDPTVDASQLATANLKFSLNAPADMTDIEVKLESVATNASLFLTNYTGVDVGNGFMEYTIPMTDFEGLDLTDLKIPFALWNPKDGNDDYLVCDVILDNIYFEE